MAQTALRTGLLGFALPWVIFCGSCNATPEIQVTTLGNEGFLIESGDTSVMIDGLYHGLGGYVAPTEEQRRARERAEPPFDTVDLVLASHHHPDHFDARVVGAFLRANHKAVFVSTPNAVELLRDSGEGVPSISDRMQGICPAEGETKSLEVDGIQIEILNLHHGRDRILPVENLGFVIGMNGVNFLHLGDTLATAEELAPLDLSAREIDVAFVPYWHLLDMESARSFLDTIGASTVVAMHLPAADAPPSYLDPASDLDGLIRMVEEAAPGVIVLTEVGDRRTIRTGG